MSDRTKKRLGVGSYQDTGVGLHQGGWTESKSAYMESAAETNARMTREGKMAMHYVDPYTQTAVAHHPDEGTRGKKRKDALRPGRYKSKYKGRLSGTNRDLGRD